MGQYVYGYMQGFLEKIIWVNFKPIATVNSRKKNKKNSKHFLPYVIQTWMTQLILKTSL